MRKSLRRRSKKSRKSRKSRKYGGSFYPYNRNPVRFTTSTTLMGGAPTLNVQNTLIPQGVVNLARNFVYNNTPTVMNGSYAPVNPDPVVQPINKSLMGLI